MHHKSERKAHVSFIKISGKFNTSDIWTAEVTKSPKMAGSKCPKQVWGNFSPPDNGIMGVVVQPQLEGGWPPTLGL